VAVGAAVGAVSGIHRYPVKSMLGESLPHARVDACGVSGDRAWGLVHRDTGRVASAKQPRLWRGLLTFTAAGAGAGVRITAEDGECRAPTDPGVHSWLSRRLGQPVDLVDSPPAGATLERAEPDQVLLHGITTAVATRESALRGGGSFADFAALHLVTTSTLAHLAALSPRRAVEWQRYRPNLLIATPPDGLVENAWPGRTLHIGPDLVLRVLLPTPRCAVPTLAHGRLPRDPDALRVPARHNRVTPLPALGPLPCVGVYADVLHPGEIRSGDTVRLA
jgi:uncharacterized protein YcbX